MAERHDHYGKDGNNAGYTDSLEQADQRGKHETEQYCERHRHENLAAHVKCGNN